ncbi:MAG: hypothetical protein U1D31_02080 [Patescibacteria group bacterium]|nr:hypothetical protein [bacterium]MDZ4240892.1 hypothetical protein [Patescibacteria group bacterium]
MAKSKEKLFAHTLRREGKSILYISQQLNIAKSTVSVWCKDITLTSFQKSQLHKNSIIAGHKGRMIGAMQNHLKKLQTIETYRIEAEKNVGRLSAREQLLLGTALYWAEGGRKSSGFSFVNSDPNMIAFISKWLQGSFQIQKEDFIPRIYINELHKPRAEKILKFWSALLQLPRNQFRRISFIKTKQKKMYENYDNYYGMLALKIRRSTNLKYKVMGLIGAIKN